MHPYMRTTVEHAEVWVALSYVDRLPHLVRTKAVGAAAQDIEQDRAGAVDVA